MERIKTCKWNDIFFHHVFLLCFPPWPRSQLKGKGIAICDTLSFQSTSFSFIWYSLDIWFSSYLSFLSIIFHMQWQRERQIWQKRVIFCFSNTSSFSRPTGGRLSIQDNLSLLIVLNMKNWKAVKFSFMTLFLLD